MRKSFFSVITAAILGMAAFSLPMVAQRAAPRDKPASSAASAGVSLDGRVGPKAAVFDAVLYTAGANVQEASDTGKAALATEVLRRVLRDSLGPALIDSAAVARAARSEAARALAGNNACSVIVACARAIGKDLGAGWVVLAKVSKTSNLIWLLSGQLIDVNSGEIVLDDSTELKGDPTPMIRAGVRIFADRVARTIHNRASSSEAVRTGHP